MKKPAPVHIPSWALIHSRRRFCLRVKMPRTGGTGRNPSHASRAGWPGQLSVPSPSAMRVYLPRNNWWVYESVVHGRLLLFPMSLWLRLMPQCCPVLLHADVSSLALMPSWRPCCHPHGAPEGNSGKGPTSEAAGWLPGPCSEWTHENRLPRRSSGTCRTSLASVSGTRNKTGWNCHPIFHRENLF